MEGILMCSNIFAGMPANRTASTIAMETEDGKGERGRLERELGVGKEVVDLSESSHLQVVVYVWTMIFRYIYSCFSSAWKLPRML